jgi:sugar/nucleoside kinase (ribokinase family)
MAAMLVTVGDLVEDVVVWLDREPQRGTDTPARIHRVRGGSAANVAAFASAAGAPARFIGRVGFDDLGRALAQGLSSCGVDVRVQHGGRSGSIVVLVHPDGERTMLPDRGACTGLAPIPIEWLDGVRILHLPAYSLTVEPLASAARAAAVAARRAGARLSVDASSVHVLRAHGVDGFLALLDELRPAWFFANEEEATLLGRRPRHGVTIVKHGAQPVHVFGEDGDELVIEVPLVEGVVDTTGAGDAFAAGVLAACWRGEDVSASVRAGTALAARVLIRPGASL